MARGEFVLYHTLFMRMFAHGFTIPGGDLFSHLFIKRYCLFPSFLSCIRHAQRLFMFSVQRNAVAFVWPVQQTGKQRLRASLAGRLGMTL